MCQNIFDVGIKRRLARQREQFHLKKRPEKVPLFKFPKHSKHEFSYSSILAYTTARFRTNTVYTYLLRIDPLKAIVSIDSSHSVAEL